MSAVLIVNPVAGGGRAARAARVVAPIVRRHWPDAAILATAGPGHATRLASEAARAGAERVIVVGGDGTLQEVAAGLVRRGVDGPAPVMGAISMGRGNDLARTLGLPRRAAAAAEVACSGAPLGYDVGLAGDRIFLSAGGAGFDAGVAAAVNAATRPWQRSKVAYLATTLAQLRSYRNRDLVIEIDGERIERRCLLVAVANGRYYGGGMRICPDADMHDGMLDVCIIGDLARAETLRELPTIFSGRHVRHPAVEMRRGRHIRLEGAGTRLHLDGENAGMLPVEMRVLPDALSIAAASTTHV